MSHPAIRRPAAVLALASLMVSPVAGFDTYWHSLCSRKVGEQFGFTDHAWKILQLGNFSPDFFGPVSEYAVKSPKLPDAGLDQYQANNAQVRGAALFLHFDNRNRKLQGNSAFDYIFDSLLQQTRALLAGYGQLNVDERVRKTLTLVTLGAALHAVQDFYSHSDWIHNDFDATEVRMVRQEGGALRAPTWFEFRDRYGDPSKWPIQVRSGIYPPVAGERYTHTHMNHDNSRLAYAEPENSGPALRPQSGYHNAGPIPARGDEESDLAHQQLAVDTAAAASIEFVRKVEENAGANRAIESARTWNLRGKDARLARELQAGIYTSMALSCAAGRWDGDNPPAARGVLCRTVLEGRANSAADAGSQLESEILGLATSILMPAAIKFTGMFWDVHGKYHILEHLAGSFGSDTADYRFPKP